MRVLRQLSVITLILVMALTEAKAAESTQTNDVDFVEEISAVDDVDAISAILEGEEVTSELPLDNDALFNEYTEIQLTISSASKNASVSGSKLSGTDRLIYLALKEDISKVADGKLASTVFEVSSEELGINDKSWTAKELGVSAIVKDGSITEEAQDALRQKLYDLDKINYALLSDCPYELYWYDKVSGVSAEGPTVYPTLNNTAICVDDKIVFSFSVASDYAAGPYTVDTTKAERVQSAVKKAKMIVSGYAAETDYEKLDGYRDEICKLVEYDQNASDDGSTPYGDPWQIVSVFDGDADTNVVCEGYAKSFQYLCNLSTFNRNITCISVSGIMSGGTGAGSHMWNIVNMEDGNNYLVDITNCDEGNIGADRLLFLAGSGNGNVNSGYSFACGNVNVRYQYDQLTKNAYDTAALQINSAPYKSGQENPIPVKTGWQQENGYWYYYDTAGNLVKNTWKKDSKGWCYLGKDGRMVTNSWARDSKGWCYLGKDGHLVINGWAKDSHGWCWMGKDGYWSKNKWILDKGEWYYLKANGYMAANEWAKDSGGWMYMNASGKITKSKWVKSGGYWYYLKANGYMATGTLTISGKTYKFDSSGKWIS